jgi:hypothetical protein
MPPDFVSNRPAGPDPRRDKPVPGGDKTTAAGEASGLDAVRRAGLPKDELQSDARSKNTLPKDAAEKRVQQNAQSDVPMPEPSGEDDGAYGEADVRREDLEAPLPAEKRSKLRWKKKEMPGARRTGD